MLAGIRIIWLAYKNTGCWVLPSEFLGWGPRLWIPNKFLKGVYATSPDSTLWKLELLPSGSVGEDFVEVTPRQILKN